MRHFPHDLILTLLDRYIGVFFWGGEDGSVFVSPLIQDTSYLHCFGLYTLINLLKYVKNVHLHASLISQASQIVLSL